jgi:hypothetical protein
MPMPARQRTSLAQPEENRKPAMAMVPSRGPGPNAIQPWDSGPGRSRSPQDDAQAAGLEHSAGQEAQPGRAGDGAAVERPEIERGEYRHQAAGDAEQTDGDAGKGRRGG